MCSFSFIALATTLSSTLSLHDALPICPVHRRVVDRLQPLHPRADARHPVRREDRRLVPPHAGQCVRGRTSRRSSRRSEEHTSELQSPDHLVCRLLLEKKKKKQPISIVR